MLSATAGVAGQPCGTGTLALGANLRHLRDMSPAFASALMPLARLLDPERAHRLALAGLRMGLAGRAEMADPLLATRALGLDFASPIGLAAGFDKDAVAVTPLLALGFGFVEVGTVTPLPQPGNDRPRVFRLTEDAAIINRLGFNGAGAAAMADRLGGTRFDGPMGINLGINKQGARPAHDYAALVDRLGPFADYLVINVSSPNTPGLWDLQTEQALTDILGALPMRRPKLLVKLSPDLPAASLAPLIEACIANGVDGLVISNTTTARPPGLRGMERAEPGGLSGVPLFARSTAMLAAAYVIAAGRLTLIGAGGVSDGATALAKLRAGASLVQLYTSFAYAGPALIGRINRELAALLRAQGCTGPADVVGSDAVRLCAVPA